MCAATSHQLRRRQLYTAPSVCSAARAPCTKQPRACSSGGLRTRNSGVSLLRSPLMKRAVELQSKRHPQKGGIYAGAAAPVARIGECQLTGRGKGSAGPQVVHARSSTACAVLRSLRGTESTARRTRNRSTLRRSSLLTLAPSMLGGDRVQSRSSHWRNSLRSVALSLTAPRTRSVH